MASGQAHHHGHEHGNERRVLWALRLTVGFMAAEVVGGLLSGSLALLADAGHMLTDAAALGLAWHAFRVSRRPATPARSYGHARFQVLAALINGAALFLVAFWIILEAISRLRNPIEVLGGPMLAVASLGLAVNIAAYVILHGARRDNLNIRGALLHVMSDLLGSAAAILAACVILLTGWTPIDPILSVLVALLILRGAWLLLGQSWHVLMEGAPEGLDVAALRRELPALIPGVLDIHHVHAWSLTPERRLVTLHASIAEHADHDDVLHRIQMVLAKRFSIDHATIQIERNHCTDIDPHTVGEA
jgi:cobalt-zinc-cadmium efflux system protein